jgi:hypothetical protein
MPFQNNKTENNKLFLQKNNPKYLNKELDLINENHNKIVLGVPCAKCKRKSGFPLQSFWVSTSSTTKKDLYFNP